MSVFDYQMKPWVPMQRMEFDATERARQDALVAARGEADKIRDSEVWLNDEYQATVGYLGEDRTGVCHLSIKRTDKRPAHDWRDLQSIKNEVMGPEREAIEIYPAESRLHDNSDQTHLWVMPVGNRIEIGYLEREVMTSGERRRTLEELDPAVANKGSQRDWRPGISTGPDYNPGRLL